MWSLVFHEPGCPVDAAAPPVLSAWCRVTAWLGELKKVCKRPSCKTASGGCTDQARQTRPHVPSVARRQPAARPQTPQLLHRKQCKIRQSATVWSSSSCRALGCARSLNLQHLVRRAEIFNCRLRVSQC